MELLFWICWSVEFILACWWVLTEMRYTHLKPNMFAFITTAYLLLIPAIRFMENAIRLSNLMVFIPAIALAFIGAIILLAIVTKTKWN